VVLLVSLVDVRRDLKIERCLWATESQNRMKCLCLKSIHPTELYRLR